MPSFARDSSHTASITLQPSGILPWLQQQFAGYALSGPVTYQARMSLSGTTIGTTSTQLPIADGSQGVLRVTLVMPSQPGVYAVLIDVYAGAPDQNGMMEWAVIGQYQGSDPVIVQ